MKSLSLKTVVFTAALAASSAFAAEVGPPFEQTQFDRTLPNVPERTVAEPASGGGSVVSTRAGPASAGASVVTTGAGLASGAWAKDHNFIAPPK